MAPKKGSISPRRGIFTNPIPRFFKYLLKKGHNECWDWSGWKNPEGYGYITVNGYDIRVHRFSYELYKGKIPQGLFVCHSCDNPSCVNPKHLWLGNNSANMIDMNKKNRAKHTKLTSQSVKKIRELFGTGKYTRNYLGKMFGVTSRNIGSIVSHKIWKWLD